MVSGQASCSALVHVSSTAAHLKGPREHKWLHVQFPVSLFIRPCVVFHSVAFRQGVYAPFPSNASWLGPAVIKSSWTLLVGAGLGAVEYEMPLCACVCRFWSGLRRREDWAYSIFTVFTQTPAASYCILLATRTFWGTQKSWWVNVFCSQEKKSHHWNVDNSPGWRTLNQSILGWRDTPFCGGFYCSLSSPWNNLPKCKLLWQHY